MVFNEKNPTEVMCMEFSVKAVNLGKKIAKDKHEYKMSDQMMRAATAIGASYGEAQYAESPADFVHKIRVSLKENHEVLYWLEVLQRTGYINEVECAELYDEANRIQKVLTSIVNTRRKNAGLG